MNPLVDNERSRFPLPSLNVDPIHCTLAVEGLTGHYKETFCIKVHIKPSDHF